MQQLMLKNLPEIFRHNQLFHYNFLANMTLSSQMKKNYNKMCLPFGQNKSLLAQNFVNKPTSEILAIAHTLYYLVLRF